MNRHLQNALFALLIVGLTGMAIYGSSVLLAGLAVLVAAIWVFRFPDSGNDDENDVFHKSNRLNTP
jgi:hypothetical protein